MVSERWQIFTQFGLAGLIFGGFLLVLHWVFKVNHKILSGMEEERKAYQQSLKGFNDNIRDLSTSAKAFYDKVKQEHQDSAEEHKELLKEIKELSR
jgi:flagellar biosynthesis/type III secretory pathway M-ring protein FliF/YscJ